MGLEVLEEFQPFTPSKTIPVTRRSGIINSGQPQEIISADLEKTKEKEEEKDVSLRNSKNLDDEEEEGSHCQTPKSAASILKPTMVCPPAPKKPRPPRRKLSFQTQDFFQVPDQDLASVYFDLKTPNFKKMRAI